MDPRVFPETAPRTKRRHRVVWIDNSFRVIDTLHDEVGAVLGQLATAMRTTSTFNCRHIDHRLPVK
jgi:hypothetical protein